MPCYSLITQTMEMRNARFDVLVAGLKADGWTITTDPAASRVLARKGDASVDFQAGQLHTRTVTVAEGQRIANAVKRAYSREAVRVSALRAGFHVQNLADGRVIATRRS